MPNPNINVCNIVAHEVACCHGLPWTAMQKAISVSSYNFYNSFKGA